MTADPAAEGYAIRRLGAADREAALAVINEAARWYREFLPPDVALLRHGYVQPAGAGEGRLPGVSRSGEGPALRSSLTYEKTLSGDKP